MRAPCPHLLKVKTGYRPKSFRALRTPKTSATLASMPGPSPDAGLFCRAALGKLSGLAPRLPLHHSHARGSHCIRAFAFLHLHPGIRRFQSKPHFRLLPMSPMKPFVILLSFLLAACGQPKHEDLPSDMKNLPPDKIEAALPNGHPSDYYRYAGRLFQEGKKDDAVFWFYVGQLRYRFHLQANPKLDPSGDPAVFSSLSATIGQTMNEYAGGSVKGWVKAMERALQWDAEAPNGFTSKQKFAAIYGETRAGLKKLRDQVESQADSIRDQRKKAGLENRD